MGYIYMADVETFDGICGIRIGRTINLPARMASHKNDRQWRKFKPLWAWEVDDEKTAESILKRALKQYGRPIHGNEKFCHSVNPIQITCGGMDDGKRRPLSTEPTAAEQYGVLILFATLAAMLFVPVLVIAIQIFCEDVAWFFSTYTVPFLIGAAWVALCAVPITACVFYRYGMSLAVERGEI